MADPEPVRITVLPGRNILADLAVPRSSRGLVIFAHGSGSGRKSPRNRRVALALNRVRIATLLLDLLTPEEAKEDERLANFRFDLRLLTERLVRAITWSSEQPRLSRLPLGLYGASTGAAAALRGAAAFPLEVSAMVLRGGRTDLAPEELVQRVRAPTLLIVGERDESIVEVNRATLRTLPSSSELVIVPRATHLFEEPGAMEEVERRTRGWFDIHLRGSRVTPQSV
ncbi:MAG: alpha/beta hydrolase [Euryarchaeota archaeon]|nr:alpha/beta hydrolase [Euryarchaeota archaeon]MDE1880482.1 alpha/beta hydrolase [Euryarchaeota archaeon]